MVSIIVTHKKDTLYLKDCLESIAEQQFKDYETILVVDHTEDNIEPLIEEFKDKINLKVFYLEDKHGVSSARTVSYTHLFLQLLCLKMIRLRLFLMQALQQ